MSFRVHVEPSGHAFTAEADETILDAALRHGLAFPYGCRSGACGSCKGKLVAGEVDYGDNEPRALTDEDRLVGMSLFCLAMPAGDVTIEVKEVGEAAEIPIRTLPAKVARTKKLADDVMGLWLKLPDEERLQYLAGQYIDILLQDGRKRAFSLANPPHEDALLELHIRHIRGGEFTDWVFEELEPKAILRIEGPKGGFYLREDSDAPALLLATGTGFAPVKAIVEHAIAEGLTRPLHIYWGGRTREELYLDALARGWAQSQPNITYTPVLSRPDGAWPGRTGHVQEAVLKDFDDLNGYEVYACGLPRMVYDAREALVSRRGLDPERYYSDAFEFAKE